MAAKRFRTRFFEPCTSDTSATTSSPVAPSIVIKVRGPITFEGIIANTFSSHHSPDLGAAKTWLATSVFSHACI